MSDPQPTPMLCQYRKRKARFHNGTGPFIFRPVYDTAGGWSRSMRTVQPPSSAAPTMTAVINGM